MKKTRRFLSLLLVLAMTLALVPAVFAGDLTQGTIASVSVTGTQTVGETITASAACSKAAEGEGHEDGHTVTYSTTSEALTLVSGGQFKASHAGMATITATCACGETATSSEITISKATLTVPTLTNFNTNAGATEAAVKQNLTFALTTALADNAAKYDTSAEWTLLSGEFANTAETGLTYTKTLGVASGYADDYEIASEASVSCTVTFKPIPEIGALTEKVNGTAGTSLKIQKGTTDQKLSVDEATATPEGCTISYQWHKLTSASAVANDGTVISGATSREYTIPAADVANVGTTYYVCTVSATKDGVSMGINSKVFTVEVVSPLRVTFTKYNSTTATVGNRLTYIATVQKWDASKSEYVTATANTDFSKVTFTTNNANLATVATGYTSSTAVSPYVYVDCKAAGTVTLSADIYQSSSKTATSSESISISAASVSNVTMNPSGSYAVIDMSKLSSAVYSATYNSSLSTGTYPTKFTFSSSYGTFSSSNSSSSTSSTTVYTSSSYATYFTPSTSYANFANSNIYVSYTAYYSDNTIATGKIYFTAASSISYSTTASTSVSFSYSDFLDFYRKCTYSSATLNYISITGAPYIASGTGTLGTLYYNSYAYSTTSSYYNSYFSNISASYANYLSYTPSSSLTTYTVNIPFTLTGSSSTVSGYVTIKVNDGHVIGMTGTSFKTANIWSDITSTYAGASYVMFTQPASSVGKLYYGYSSIANKGTAVTYLDKFNNTSYATSYASTYKSIEGVYFVPAADCLSTVTISYTAYNASGYALGSGTISFTVTKKTASYWFNDVTASNTGNWSADAIDFLAANSIVEGSSSYGFNPNGYMTRGDFVLMLYRAAGKPSVSGVSNPFTDVKTADYYYNAVLWAYKNNIVTGSSKTTFAPKKNITREQIAATLYRMAGSPTTSGSISGYYDSNKVHNYALSAMKWAVANGILAGSNGYLTPGNNATRAQVATMLHRYLTK